MDRIFGISKALDYIEQHITEPTDYEAIAKCENEKACACRRRAFCRKCKGD